MIRYQLELTPDDNDTFLVTCPDLPEVTTFGDDEASAYANGAAAVAEAVAARLADFTDIPRPADVAGGVALDTQLSLKVQLKWTMEAAGVNRAELVRRLGVHRPQVDRLFDPNHATRMDKYDGAFRALGVSLDIDVLPESPVASFVTREGQMVEIDTREAFIGSIGHGEDGTYIMRYNQDDTGQSVPSTCHVQEPFYYVTDALARASKVRPVQTA